eukprot:351845-Chlamydomonas_euryale.AAC.1
MHPYVNGSACRRKQGCEVEGVLLQHGALDLEADAFPIAFQNLYMLGQEHGGGGGAGELHMVGQEGTGGGCAGKGSRPGVFSSGGREPACTGAEAGRQGVEASGVNLDAGGQGVDLTGQEKVAAGQEASAAGQTAEADDLAGATKSGAAPHATDCEPVVLVGSSMAAGAALQACTESCGPGGQCGDCTAAAAPAVRSGGRSNDRLNSCTGDPHGDIGDAIGHTGDPVGHTCDAKTVSSSSDEEESSATNDPAAAAPSAQSYSTAEAAAPFAPPRSLAQASSAPRQRSAAETVATDIALAEAAAATAVAAAAAALD